MGSVVKWVPPAVFGVANVNRWASRKTFGIVAAQTSHRRTCSTVQYGYRIYEIHKPKCTFVPYQYNKMCAFDGGMIVYPIPHTVRHITFDGGMLNTKSLVWSSSCHPHTWGAALLSFYQIDTAYNPHNGCRYKNNIVRRMYGRRPMYGSTYPWYSHRPRLTTSRRRYFCMHVMGTGCTFIPPPNVICRTVRVSDIRNLQTKMYEC